MKYVISAISRLTRERVVISSPMEKNTAACLMAEKKRKQHSHSVYSRMRLEPADHEGDIW